MINTLNVTITENITKHGIINLCRAISEQTGILFEVGSNGIYDITDNLRGKIVQFDRQTMAKLWGANIDTCLNSDEIVFEKGMTYQFHLFPNFTKAELTIWEEVFSMHGITIDTMYLDSF